MTIQTQDAFDNPANVTGDTTIDLTSTSGAGRFDTNAAGAFDSSVTSVTITNGSNSENFYYKDTAAGSPTITATENPSQTWADATQQQTVNAGAVSQIAFNTSAQTITAGQVFGVMTIQTQDAFDNPANVASDTTISLSSTSGNGTFYSDAAGTMQITSVILYNGANSASFYYKDTAAGTTTITAAESPDQGLTDATQQQRINVQTQTIGNGRGTDRGTDDEVYLIVELDGATTSEKVSEETSELKGSIFATSPDGQIELKIVAGNVALKKDGTRVRVIKIVTIPAEEVPQPQNRDYSVLHAWDFGPDGATFSKLLVVTINYAPEELPLGSKENELHIAYWNETEWIPIVSVVDTKLKTVTIRIDHFTAFALVARVYPDRPALLPTPPAPPPQAPPASATNWVLIGAILGVGGVILVLLIYIVVRFVRMRYN